MLTVTKAALDRLSTKLDRKSPEDGASLRFTRRTDGWRLRLDRARPADTEIVHQGRSVLVMDEDVTRAMANMTLDVERTDEGPRLRLREPASSKE